MPTLAEIGQSFDFFPQKSWSFCDINSVKTKWHYTIYAIFPNVFEFTIFLFETKYNILQFILLIAIIYSCVVKKDFSLWTDFIIIW